MKTKQHQARLSHGSIHLSWPAVTWHPAEGQGLRCEIVECPRSWPGAGSRRLRSIPCPLVGTGSEAGFLGNPRTAATFSSHPSTAGAMRVLDGCLPCPRPGREAGRPGELCHAGDLQRLRVSVTGGASEDTPSTLVLGHPSFRLGEPLKKSDYASSCFNGDCPNSYCGLPGLSSSDPAHPSGLIQAIPVVPILPPLQSHVLATPNPSASLSQLPARTREARPPSHPPHTWLRPIIYISF